MLWKVCCRPRAGGDPCALLRRRGAMVRNRHVGDYGSPTARGRRVVREATMKKIKAVLAAAGCTVLAGSALAGDVTFERLRNPEPQNWLMNHGDYSAHRYSSLDQINKANVKNLKLKFSVAIGGKGGNE